MPQSRFAAILSGLILSGFMTLVVSGVSTWRVLGLAEWVFGLWMSAWLASWIVAFPVILLAAPVTRRLVGRLVSRP